MPYTINYPDGTQLSSSGLSAAQMEQVFQTLSIGMLGIDSIPPKNQSSWLAVRCAFQQKGQPSWAIDTDTAIVSALIDEAEPYGRTRDRGRAPNNDVSIQQLMSYTRVWRLHWDLYGPNAQQNAEILLTGFSEVEWVFNWLRNGCNGAALWPIYVVSNFPAPVRAPENFQRQWWERSTLDLRFNELVIQSLIVPIGISVEITVTASTGETETFTVTAPLAA